MILAILQARMSSTRLPGKSLALVAGQPMLLRQIERVQRASSLDSLIVATSTDSSDDPLVAFCAEIGVACFRGSLDDVLDRYYHAALEHGAEHIVRLTGDCPLIDPEVIDAVVSLHLSGGYDYTSNTITPTYPDGLDVEALRLETLETAWREARLPSEREHVTLWVKSRDDRFRLGSVVDEVDRSAMRWTVDELADYEFVREVYSRLYPTNPCFVMSDVVTLLEQNPSLAELNAGIERNEGLVRSLAEDVVEVDEGGGDV